MPGYQFANISLEVLLLAASTLLVFSVLASKISTSFGVPTLLIFLGIGMLAGSEGPGGIEFTNYSVAYAIGSVSLAIIMFDGGFTTSWKSVRPVLSVGVSLASLGVLVTAILTGVFSHYFLSLSWIEALLLGSIVSSTDAAAVFSILRANSLSLKGKLKQTLEFEAGSNDPSAIFLTVGVLAFATGQIDSFGSMVLLFLNQVGLGLIFGYLGGKGSRLLINNVGIEYEGLYSVLLLSLVLFVFSVTAALGGSGFLAVYVMGIVVGNSDMLHKGSLLRFNDGIAWIAQITVFLTLGLLTFPTSLVPLWKEGILLALFMMFIARPISVLVAAPTKVFDSRERTFISWVGLRGAAPIILATLPWSVNFPNSEYFFNLVFFVVLISVVAQGMSIPWIARKLELTKPLRKENNLGSNMGFLPAGFVSVEIEVMENSAVVNKRIVDLGLPSGVLLTSLEREERFIIPKGDTVLSAGDRIWGLARPSRLQLLEELFGSAKITTAST